MSQSKTYQSCQQGSQDKASKCFNRPKVDVKTKRVNHKSECKNIKVVISVMSTRNRGGDDLWKWPYNWHMRILRREDFHWKPYGTQNTRNTESTKAAGVKGSDGAALVKVSTDQDHPPPAMQSSPALFTYLVPWPKYKYSPMYKYKTTLRVWANAARRQCCLHSLQVGVQ